MPLCNQTINPTPNPNLRFLPGNAEQVDVSVVDGEIQKHGSAPSVQPQVVFEEAQLNQRLLPGARQVLVEPSASVFRHLTPETASVGLALGRVHPAWEEAGMLIRPGAFSLRHTCTGSLRPTQFRSWDRRRRCPRWLARTCCSTRAPHSSGPHGRSRTRCAL